jgi:hypothetical protein
MKKLLIFCFLLLVSVPLATFAKSNVSGIYLADEIENGRLFINVTDKQRKNLLSNIVLLPESPYDKESAGAMIERLSVIHPNILKALSNNGVKMKLFTGRLTDQPAFAHLKGERPKGWSEGKTWDDVPGAGGSYIAAAKIGASKFGKGHGSINLELHEIAHSIDNIVFKSLRNDEEFREAWSAEVKELFPDRPYFTNYPEEYFAEVFAMYYYNEKTKKQLKNTAPKTYDYIKQLESKEFKRNVITHL